MRAAARVPRASVSRADRLPTRPILRAPPTRRATVVAPGPRRATVVAPHPPQAATFSPPTHVDTSDKMLREVEANVADTTDAASAAADDATFKWTANWYPVLAVEGWTAVDSGRPHAIQVLGLDLVAWRDDDGVWRAARDSCPHRLAPLSEGRIDPNPRAGGKRQLLCSYHGWAWDGCGKCTRIPQSEHDPAALTTSLASPRTRLTTYPTTVACGLLFVWPEADPGAAARAAAAAPPPVPTECVDTIVKKGWYVRDMPYPYEVLVENIADPAHLPVSHHGIGSLNRVNAGPVPHVRRPEAMADPAATLDFNIASCLTEADDIASQSRLTFYAPAHVYYRWADGPVRRECTCLYATPTGPGRSRVFMSDASFVEKQPDGTATPAPQETVWDKVARLGRMSFLLRDLFLPHFFVHFGQSELFDADAVLLFGQAERLDAAAAAAGMNPAERVPWAKSYYLVSSDNCAASIRAWMDRVGGGRPAFAPGAPPPPVRPLPAHVALDRAAQHTALCPVCQRGQARTTVARNTLIGVAAGGIISASIAAARLAVWPAAVAVGVATLAAAGAGVLHRRVLPQFGYVGHVHADKD